MLPQRPPNCQSACDDHTDYCEPKFSNPIPLQNYTDDMTIVDDLVAVFSLFIREENVSISISFYLPAIRVLAIKLDFHV